MEAKHVRTLMEAYASVYEGYGKKKKGDCVSKSEKGDHNCAKKVCHEEYGEGETIFGQHAVPDENGFVSHYNVQFEHGIVENVSVEDMDILTMEAHGEHVEHEGETISEEDVFDIVKGHLIDEGFADTEEAALAIMANMSEGWRNQIVEQSSTRSMAAQVTDALPWNRNTKYTTQGKLRNPGENVHGQQTGKTPKGTASMGAK